VSLFRPAKRVGLYVKSLSLLPMSTKIGTFPRNVVRALRYQI